MSTLNLSGRIACFSSMQKRSDFFGWDGTRFYCRIREWQHLHAKGGFKTEHAVTVVTLSLFSCRGGQSYEILGFGGSRYTGDWEHLKSALENSHTKLKKALLPTLGLWIHKSANIPWSSNPCSIFRYPSILCLFFSTGKNKHNNILWSRPTDWMKSSKSSWKNAFRRNVWVSHG